MKVFTTEEQFLAILASSPPGGVEGQVPAAQVADGAARMLEPRMYPSAMYSSAMSPDAAVEKVLATLPAGAHVPFSILQVEGGNRARLVECNAPPLFLARGGGLILPPVLEEETAQGHLVRKCQFLLQAGDHLAMVSEGYVRARGWSRRWGWQDIAISIKRWTDTGCDAEQLLGALVRMHRRLAEGPAPSIAEGPAPSAAEGEASQPGSGQAPRPGSGQAGQDVTVIAMHVRPIRTVTVWTGPPSDPAQDALALETLMAEPGVRVICGDTTAQIAARLLGTALEMEPRPEGGADKAGRVYSPAGCTHPPSTTRSHPWAEVPPISRLSGVGLVTEGLVTLEKARERLAKAKRVSDLPRGEDGATRLAHVLLAADKVHLIVGLAVNPAQAADVSLAVPLRQVVIEQLVRDLKSRDKLVSLEYV
ncbi:MAG TPA: hypothetical protein VMY80_02445 [Anaerolineae bacterium]|nr:hypothetical protein [Anaerolineae bacterium]